MFTAIMSAFGVFCASAIMMYVIFMQWTEINRKIKLRKWRHKMATYKPEPKRRRNHFWRAE